ncbi:DUF427 domain-containing protein [Frigoriglobus tundricola]|uniref:DUF427 domain-containing protein n=1 Tax=Frigoriglobus tundricola TaxID=2774151 RepID=A0A6M5YZN4_9BACT|nr:DUF427 domain-containing protein [Frigoriglobus tundricola]QJW98916.1 hypothetical protein FTUN_6511 [Frigoriglobus tundricola]
MRTRRIEPGPGQESVWDYPRPPRLEDCGRHLVVRFNGVVVAETRRGKRVLETSHPPVYYFPPEDVRAEHLVRAPGGSFCEFKGAAGYYTVAVGDREAPKAAWFYPDPTPEFEGIRGFIAFYAGPMDECRVDGQLVTPQPGGFYGGWVTPDVVGPFKGEPGTAWW